MRSLTLTLFLAASMFAQYPGLHLPPSGKNQKAAVTQFVGPVEVSIEYSSPAVHGPDGKDRRGQIWGKLVPYGLTEFAFGNKKPAPWRAGANENTVFAVSHDVKVEGQPLAAGRYGLFMIAGPEEWTVVFSKNSEAWGSFFYEESEDALRVKVKPHKHEYREWLTYEFTERKPDRTVAELQWEDLAVPVTITVDNPNQIYLTRLKHDLTTVPGFNYEGYVTAAQFCLNNDVDLEQGLRWADAAIAQPFIGQKNFETLSLKSQILSKLKREDESAKLMQEALQLPGTTAVEIHMYGRQLQAQKKEKEAVEVFKLNAERHGDEWPVHVGLARAYAYSGDLQQALEHAKKALAQAPDPLNRQSLEDMIQKFSKGENIPQ